MQHKVESALLSQETAPEVPAAVPLLPRTVFLPTALDAGFDYLLPETTPVGALVEVALRGRKMVGMAGEGAAAGLAASKLKPVLRVLDMPPFSAEYRGWLRFIAAYTLAPIGAVMGLTQMNQAASLPKRPLKPVAYHPNLPGLSPEQAQAARDMHAASLQPGAKPMLLNGITGSGKTEVYFQLMAELMQDETAQILVMLPEIALTHQWLTRFEQAFGAPPHMWHSSITPARRRALWHAVADGTARVVVGARSALALPYKHLKLIIVDEEHDTSYKQEDGVLYHARDMAVARAKYAGAQVVLASATPSLETRYNVQIGRYDECRLTTRHGAAHLPDIQLVNLRDDAPDSGEFLAPALRQAMRDTLNRGEQALLFLNRRGYAPLLLCRGCGHRFMCENCSAWLVLHQKAGRLSCHHCGHQEKAPTGCPNCDARADKLAPCGPGVERVAEEVATMFPELALGEDIVVFSSDEKGMEAQISRAITGDIKVLIGTQMLAKGHHFPNLTLVGVVDADLGLAGGDLRAGEHTYQMLEQIAGRAGRAEKPGRVLLQTYLQEHPVMQALAQTGKEMVGEQGAPEGANQFSALELESRKVGNWPPFGKLAAIILDGPDEQVVKQAGFALLRAAPQDTRLRVLGPAPAPLSKLRGQYRYRLLVKAEKTINMQQTLKNWLAPAQFKNVRLKLDVNPYYFL